MKPMKHLALGLLTLAGLWGCGAAVIRAEGPYLQVGPTDALIGELSVPDRETCQQLLVQYMAVYKISKCAAESANLPFAGVVRHDFQGITLPISARSLAACKDLEKRIGQSNGWHVVEPCKRVAKTPAGAESKPQL